MARIVIDARELRTSSGRYVERLLHYLQQLETNHEFSVLLKPKDMAGWHPSNPSFVKISCPHKEFTFAEQFGLLSQVRSLKPDLVHFTFTQQPVLYTGPVVTTVHDLTTLRFRNPDKQPALFKFKQLVYAGVTKRVARKSTRLITCSQFVKNDLATYAKINAEKISVIYEAADSIAEPAQPLLSLRGSKFIMYVGRPTPHKNLSRLLEAFVQLKAQHPDLLLVLAGKKDANYMRIESEVAQRTIKNVVFTDFVNEGQLRWLYENCAAYVFPSLSEGFGLPGLEAMAQGAPVVSSNATCLPEIYGQAAHYFDPTDTQAMADAINEVLTDKSLRARLQKAGAKQVATYSWKQLAEKTLDTYNQALNS